MQEGGVMGTTITPFLWFDRDAEEAVNFYVSVFPEASVENVTRYGDAGPGEPGSVMTIEFRLAGQDYMAINAETDVAPPGGMYQGAVAFFVTCQTQSQLDELWEKLLDGGEAIQCGWLRDRYGFAWNVVPEGLGEVLSNPRAMKAMLNMIKLDINVLRAAAAE
jgi:predicted 3-demethylubiquinone-9 3-methyltransferase (glyoxalase superfamily)